MKWNEIRRLARQVGVNTRGLKKAQVIHALQRVEGNFDCFGRSNGYCDRWDCAWRDDCLTSARKSARKSA